MEAELTCPLNTWHEGWKKETHFSLPDICGILITMYSIAETLVGYWVGKFLSATPNQNNTNNIDVGICGAGQALAWPLFELLYTLKQNQECGRWLTYAIKRSQLRLLRSPWSVYCRGSGELSDTAVAVRSDCPSAQHSQVTCSLHKHLAWPLQFCFLGSWTTNETHQQKCRGYIQQQPFSLIYHINAVWTFAHLCHKQLPYG